MSTPIQVATAVCLMLETGKPNKPWKDHCAENAEFECFSSLFKPFTTIDEYAEVMVQMVESTLPNYKATPRFSTENRNAGVVNLVIDYECTHSAGVGPSAEEVSNPPSRATGVYHMSVYFTEGLVSRIIKVFDTKDMCSQLKWSWAEEVAQAALE